MNLILDLIVCKLRPGVLHRERPGYLCVVLIASFLPDTRMIPKSCFRRYASPDGLFGEDADRTLRHVEPGRVFRGIVEGDLAHDPCGFWCAECFHKRLLKMGVQIVENDMDRGRMAGAGKLDNACDFFREVGFFPVFGHGHFPMPSSGLHGYEDVCGAVALVFVVAPSRFPLPGVFDRSGILEELFGFLVETAHGLTGIVGLGVQVKDVLHALLEFLGDRRDAPHFFPARA